MLFSGNPALSRGLLHGLKTFIPKYLRHCLCSAALAILEALQVNRRSRSCVSCVHTYVLVAGPPLSTSGPPTLAPGSPEQDESLLEDAPNIGRTLTPGEGPPLASCRRVPTLLFQRSPHSRGTVSISLSEWEGRVPRPFSGRVSNWRLSCASLKLDSL